MEITALRCPSWGSSCGADWGCPRVSTAPSSQKGGYKGLPGGGEVESLTPEVLEGRSDVVLRAVGWWELLVMGAWLDWVTLGVFSNLGG